MKVNNKGDLIALSDPKIAGVRSTWMHVKQGRPAPPQLLADHPQAPVFSLSMFLSTMSS